MNSSIIIRIPKLSYRLDENLEFQWSKLSKSNQPAAQVMQGSIKDFAVFYQKLCDTDKNKSKYANVILMLPSSMAFYRNLQLDNNKKRHLTTSISYCIEEYLVQNIEEMHIQYSALNNELGDISVCAVANDFMQHIIDFFNKYSLPVDSIIPEAQLYEAIKGSTYLLLDDEQLILVNAIEQGVFINKDILNCYLDSTLENKELKLSIKDENSKKLSENVVIKYSNDSKETNITSIKKIIDDLGINCEIKNLNQKLLHYLIGSYYKLQLNSSLIELRQGKYRCLDKRNRIISRWKPIAIALCAWVIIDIAISVGFGITYLITKNDLWKLNIEKYIDLFPNDQQAKRSYDNLDHRFDVYKILKNRLKTEHTDVKSDDLFLHMWRDVSIALDEIKAKLIPEEIEFSRDLQLIKLSFLNKDVKELQEMQLAMTKRGFEVEIEPSNNNDITCLLVRQKA